MACDLCGKASTELEPVNEIFKTDDVTMVCPSCKDMANKHIMKVRHSTSELFCNLVKEWLKNKCAEWRE